MFPSRPTKLLLLAGTVALATAWACGPFFAPTLIDGGNDALLYAPWRSLRSSLAAVTIKPVTAPARTVPDSSGIHEATIAAELADLAAAGVAPDVVAGYAQRRAQLASLENDRSQLHWYLESHPEFTSIDGLPQEFALYYKGVCALNSDDRAEAQADFAAILDLPTRERRYKGCWAAYMLGSMAAEDGHDAKAAAAFAKVRKLAHDGAVDSTGLAAASLGQEAHLHFANHEWLAATHLYLQQHAAGDPSAAMSLQWTAWQAIADSDPDVLRDFAADAEARKVITAALLAHTLWYDQCVEPQVAENTKRWLAALEKASVHDAADAGAAALAAYRGGDFEAAARWVALAPADAADACWLRAKLALRDGRVDDALPLLAKVVHAAPPVDVSLYEPYGPLFDPKPAAQAASGELGGLLLARRDYVEALTLLLRGGYWADAAYIAERVLTTDELHSYVDTHPTDCPVVADGDEGEEKHSLRLLLARRLMRDGKPAAARLYFTGETQKLLDRYTTAFAAGHDSGSSYVGRGLALFDAARLMNEHGMELCGTELDPDFAIYWGGFEFDSMLANRQKAGGVMAPSEDEDARVMASAVTPAFRHHYRYLAADLAWEACGLMPGDTPELAACLAEAGGWVKARDPKAADRFYKALVYRCPHTELGREADLKHWFP